VSEAAPEALPHPVGPAVIERRRQHPLGPVLRLKGMGQALLVGVVAGGSGGGPQRILTLVPILVLVAIRLVEWAATTYGVTGGSLRVDSGVLTRKRREVPLDRVQQVDLQRKLRHRLFGLSQLTIDAAGGTGGEVTLVVSDAEAERLRQVVASTGSDASGSVAVPAEGTPSVSPTGGRTTLVRLRPGQLALAGITGAKQLVMLALAGSALQFLDDVPASLREGAADRVPEGTVWLVAAALLAIPAWFALAALAQLATDFGFTLTSDGSMLQVRRGFPTERQASLALERVQLAQVEQSPVRRLLGVASVQLAAAGSGTSADAQVSRLTVPILAAGDVAGLLGTVLPGTGTRPALIPAPPAARRRQIVRRAVPAAGVAVLAAALLWPWGLLAAAVVPLAVAAGELAYRGLGHASTPTHVFAQRGGLWRHTSVLPLARTQSARVRQSLFQRRAGLATLSVEAAGRGNRALAIDLSADDARRLAVDATTAAAARADERGRRRRTA
jgi:putative membrane protein